MEIGWQISKKVELGGTTIRDGSVTTKSEENADTVLLITPPAIRDRIVWPYPTSMVCSVAVAWAPRKIPFSVVM